MVARQAAEYLVECFWPGVREVDLADVDRRITARVAELRQRGAAVSYLGCLLMQEDEVVFCRFEGPEPVVRHVAEQAGIRFERIVPATRSPGPGMPSSPGVSSPEWRPPEERVP